MLQAVMIAPGKIVFHDVPVPEVKPHQIKIKMKRIGVCGSDIHVNNGVHPYTNYPVVQGHEVSAEVVEIGSEVTNVKVGDRVTIQPQVVCGVCFPCTHGLYNDCEDLKVMGFQITGMASEFFVVDASKALVLPDGMDFEYGAMVEPLAVAVHAIRRAGHVTGKKILVLGGGPIGNLVAQTAKALGAETVVISEISKYRLEVAEKCGIKTIDAKNEDVFEGILKHFGKDRTDVIFECIGMDVTINQSINYARKGSTIVVVGVFGNLTNVNMGYVQDHELAILGSAMYREEDYIEAIELVNKGLIEFQLLITHRVKFKDYMHAYKIMDEQKDYVMKVMIEME